MQDKHYKSVSINATQNEKQDCKICVLTS